MTLAAVGRFFPAGDSQIDAIYAESHALWGDGLSLRDYRELWDELSGTTFGREHASFRVWGDAEDPRSSLKTYRPRARLGYREGRVTVLSAIFTPRIHRGRGHARQMVAAAVDEAAARDDLAVLLFSDIDPTFYEPFGFTRLPAEEQVGRIPREPAGADGLALRAMRDDDLSFLLRAHRLGSAARAFALDRDRSHWRFLRVRTRSFFRRLALAGVETSWSIAVRGDEPVGYLVTVEGRGEWSVREVGAVDGSSGTAAKVLAAGARRARRRGLRTFHAWLAPEVRDELGSWSLRDRPRRRAIPMLRTFGDAPALDRCFLPFQDQF